MKIFPGAVIGSQKLKKQQNKEMKKSQQKTRMDNQHKISSIPPLFNRDPDETGTSKNQNIFPESLSKSLQERTSPNLENNGNFEVINGGNTFNLINTSQPNEFSLTNLCDSTNCKVYFLCPIHFHQACIII